MPQIIIDGIDIYYETEGSGDPLFLIPGLAADLAIWQPIRNALAEHFTLIMPDPPGSGRSGDCPENFDISAFAKIWISFMQTLKIDKAHLLGQSLGGMVAQEIALIAPEKVNKLILMSTTSHNSARTQQIINSWQALKETNDTRAFFNEVLLWLVTAKYYNNDQVRESTLEFMINYPYPQSVQNFCRQAASLGSYDARDRLHNLRMSTLIVSGADDILFPTVMQHDLQDFIPHAQLEIIPDAAHSLMIEGSTRLSEVIIDFLED